MLKVRASPARQCTAGDTVKLLYEITLHPHAVDNVSPASLPMDMF